MIAILVVRFDIVLLDTLCVGEIGGLGHRSPDLWLSSLCETDVVDVFWLVLVQVASSHRCGQFWWWLTRAQFSL